MSNWYVLAATSAPLGHASVRVHTGLCRDTAIRAASALPAPIRGNELERHYGLPVLARLQVSTMEALVRALGGTVLRFRTLEPRPGRTRANILLAALPDGRIGIRTREDKIAWDGYLRAIGDVARHHPTRSSAAPQITQVPPLDTDKLFEPYVGPDWSTDE